MGGRANEGSSGRNVQNITQTSRHMKGGRSVAFFN